MRPVHLPLAIAAATVTLALPVSAHAATGYVVSLNVETGSTCDSVVADVVRDYDVAPTGVYTTALCGFSARLSSAKARNLSADSRVAAVESDARIVVG